MNGLRTATGARCSVLGCDRYPAVIAFDPNSGSTWPFCVNHGPDDLDSYQDMEAKWERKARQLLTGQEA